MSLQARLLNIALRAVEKPQLARARDPVRLRRSFERKARVLFHAPRGTTMTRTRLGDVPALRVSAPGVAQGDLPERLVLFFHGGGYIFGSARTHSAMMAQLSQRIGAPVELPDYRLAPEHRFPAALDDARTAYAACLGAGIAANRIILGGDSAGGGLALSLLADLLASGAPLPGGCFAFSPLTDLTFSGASVPANTRSDVVLPAGQASRMSSMYLGDDDPARGDVSPLFAAFDGAPPVWLTAATHEILLDDTRRMADRLRAAQVDVTERIEHDLPHVWPIFHNILPEARETLDALAGWILSLRHVTGES